MPGLLVALALGALALAVPRVLPAVPASTAAVALGAGLAAVGWHRPVLRAGTRWAGHGLVRVAVVLLGLQTGAGTLAVLGVGGVAVVLVTVTVTFVGTRAAGRLLGVPDPAALLVATGFSICGASAVAGVRDAARADEDDAAVAVALVTLCGTLAILGLPPLRGPLGLDPAAFGAWVGAGVQDVGQVVAIAHTVPGAERAAVVVKLARVVLLAPLVAVVALEGRRRDRRVAAAAAAVEGVGRDGRDGRSVSGGPGRRHRPPLVPAFVVAFLLAAVLSAAGLVPAGVRAVAADVQGVVVVAALVGLGTGITGAVLRRAAGRPLVLGLVAWVLVAGTSLLGVRLLG